MPRAERRRRGQRRLTWPRFSGGEVRVAFWPRFLRILMRMPQNRPRCCALRSDRPGPRSDSRRCSNGMRDRADVGHHHVPEGLAARNRNWKRAVGCAPGSPNSGIRRVVGSIGGCRHETAGDDGPRVDHGDRTHQRRPLRLRPGSCGGCARRTRRLTATADKRRITRGVAADRSRVPRGK